MSKIIKSKVELLAPAGSVDKARIAFMYGADAVYAGTAKLSLRSRAQMNIDTLKETIEYAHSIGKKVYAAMNIYAYDENFEDVEQEIKHLVEIKADAIIASDVGVIDTIKKLAPNMPIHISTQANTTSLRACEFWHSQGASRIILARELSRDKIEYIMKNKPKDLTIEMFIHGALCFAYSGRCYLSQYLSNRGANSGDCSQPCRWQYNITAEEVNTPGSIVNIDYDEKGTYIFSSKDLCLIGQIPNIIDMGVESLKIEGRLKTEYYLATVVKSYRQAIDDYIKEGKNWKADKYLEELEKVKTRGLCEYFYSETNNQDIHDYTGFNENLTYEYGAIVLQKLENNQVLLEIRNKLTVGDRLELVLPNTIDNIEFVITKLYDSKIKETIVNVNPGIKGQTVIIELEQEVYDAVMPDMIIRRRKKNEHV